MGPSRIQAMAHTGFVIKVKDRMNVELSSL